MQITEEIHFVDVSEYGRSVCWHTQAEYYVELIIK